MAKSKNQNLQSVPFKSRYLVICALMLALICGYQIYRALAAPTPAPANSWVFGMGKKDATYLGSSPGWWSSGTSTCWVRLPAQMDNNAHIDFVRDGSVDLMAGILQSSNGWFDFGTSAAPTLRVSILAGDKADDGSTIAGHEQHSAVQAYDERQSPNGVNGSDVQSDLCGRQPDFGAAQGQDWYYGWSFSTNPGFIPSTTGTGWWNSLHDFHPWHLATPGGNSPVGFVIATKGPAGAETGTVFKVPDSASTPLAQPHLAVNVNGGNADHPADFATATDLTMYRIIGPVWQPGQKYSVAYHVKWDAYNQGIFEWRVNGVKYGSLTNVSTNWRNAANTYVDTPYPQWENYRAYDPALAGNTNDVFYGALIKGTSLADVTIPYASSQPVAGPTAPPPAASSAPAVVVTVKDASGRPLPGAKVDIGSQDATTNPQGQAVLAGLPPGSHSGSVSYGNAVQPINSSGSKANIILRLSRDRLGFWLVLLLVSLGSAAYLLLSRRAQTPPFLRPYLNDRAWPRRLSRPERRIIKPDKR